MRSFIKALSSLAAAAALLSAAPTFAESSFCLTFPNQFIFNCSTTAMPSNRSGFYAYFEVGPFSTYNFRDSENGAILAHGVTGAGYHAQTIFGLYGFYHVEVSGSFFVNTYGYVNNT